MRASSLASPRTSADVTCLTRASSFLRSQGVAPSRTRAPRPAEVRLRKPLVVASRPTSLARASSPSTPTSSPSPEQPSALLIECDGVAIDAAVDAHRVAFNRSFAELGMDCTSWAPALYSDLIRTGDGTGEGLVAVYFNTVGWPTMLATSDHAAFALRVHSLKRKHLRLLAEGGEVPLRRGVIDLVDEALGQGARVGLLAGTQSAPEDGLGQAALRAFGRERDVAVFNVPSPSSSSPGGGDYGDGDGGDGDGEGSGPLSSSEDAPPTTMEAGFAAAAAKLKAQGAAAFVRSVAASRAADGDDGGDGVLMDPALLAASRRNVASGLSPTWLAATAAALGVRGARCAVVGANSGTLEAARGAGMVAVAAPPRQGRALGQYPMAQAVCDGFGPGGGVTWRRVAALVEKNVEEVEAAAREAERRGKL